MSCNCGSAYNNLPCCCKTGEHAICLTTTCSMAQPCNEIYESNCVLYTGEESSCLGITKGMSMTEVMDIFFSLVNCPNTTTTSSTTSTTSTTTIPPSTTSSSTTTSSTTTSSTTTSTTSNITTSSSTTTSSTTTSSTTTSTSTTTTTICPNCTVPDVTISGQIWTGCNLNVDSYADGTAIPQVTDPTQWANLTTGAWCWLNNDSTNGPIYGRLYNWQAVAGIYDAASLANPGLRKSIAPAGYRMPSDAEWTTLTTNLGGLSVAGGPLKKVGQGLCTWTNPNTGATNSSGFTGLPGGYRNSSGTFSATGYNGYWWTSTESNTTVALFRLLGFNYSYVGRTNNNKTLGMSVRLIKN